MDEKVSLIIPMYNLAEYCAYCLESVLAQTYRNIEIIIIDDGSTDKTLEICKKFTKIDGRIRLFHQRNKGVSSARNTGLANVTGKYVTFVDGDDIISERYVETLVNLMEDDTCFVVANYVRITNYNQKIFENKHVFPKRIESDVVLERLLEGKFPISVWGVLFDRNCIKNIHFPKNIRHNEDKYFLFETLIKNIDKSVIRTTQRLYGYYVRRTSVTQISWNGSIDIVKVADQIYREIKVSNPKYIKLAFRMTVGARMQIIKEIVRTPDAMQVYRHIYNKYKRQILRAGYPMQASVRKKVEYIVLKAGDPFFKILVNLYYRIYTENMRFKINEKKCK